MWGTTSLRGLLNGVLTVEVLSEGVHSGDASGVVPTSFRIARQLIDRIDNAATGVVKDRAFHAPIPAQRRIQAKRAAKVLGKEIWRKFPFAGKTQPMHKDLVELVLNRTWRPMLAVTGADGLPALASAGNVLRPKTQLQLSLRLPPSVDAKRAGERMKKLLEAKPPYGAKVSYEYGQAGTGWHSPQLASWLEKSVDEASKKHYRRPAMWMGEGGTIPFMAMLGVKFPQAQFLITGVLGPHSNAHGPNEFLHIDYAKKLTACVADVLSAHAARP
jgi:acetylornithine deacetylase/succinyl-diaminopimelate desuccinylase-like protein